MSIHPYVILYWVIWFSAVLDGIAILVMIFYERRDPASITPWVLFMILTPAVGFAVYLGFGLHYFRRKRFRGKATNDRSFYSKLNEREKRDLVGLKAFAHARNQDRFFELSRMVLLDNGDFPTAGNAVQVFTDGNPFFEDLLGAIRGAKRFVHLEFYILRDDALGKSLLTALLAKAKEGVEVRLLYDDMGNKISRVRYHELTEVGGKVSSFYRPLIAGVGFRVNYRNHRKIAIIDGTVGYIGGFNVGEEYLGRGKLGHWRDSAVRISGEGAKSLQLRFGIDWLYATKEDLTGEPKYFPPTESAGGSAIQLVTSGPDALWNSTKEQYLKMVNIAGKSLYIQTPYFVPDASLLDALRISALSGVDVRIMVPRKPDAPLVHWANLSYLGELLEAGVRAYLYEDGFLHAKTVLVDDEIISIGTANFDIRSFQWNFEANALIYDPKFAMLNRAIFEEDMRHSTELTVKAYAARSNRTKFLESVSRLASSVL